MSQQHDIFAGNKDQFMKLMEKWIIDHVEIRNDNFATGNRFTISESGAVGISCTESPSLSVMYPNTDKPPIILSYNTVYRSATFIKVSNKEYLAAASMNDGCLYLWDVKSKTSKKVFDPKLPQTQDDKGMNIFRINENTIGYGEACYSSLDQSRRVFILKTDTDEFTLSSTLRLFTPNTIFNMCYTEVEGGKPCLLLCIPHNQHIMAVEMIGGKTRWETGEQQMGEEFEPWSICTDANDTVYVADFIQRKIHLLSASHGTLVKQFDCRNYDIYNIFGVRFHDQHLYVEHVIPGSKPKYAISKFKESDDQ